MKKAMVLFGILILGLNLSAVSLAGERLSLGYIYSASKSHVEIVDATNGSISVVSPTCLNLSNNGRLKINDILDEEFVTEMHKRGIKVTPFLSNHWGRKRAQAALDNPEILVDELVEAINIYNFDGINVDLENLSASDKDKLTNFVKLLREKLPENKTLSVAVAANPNKLTTTWVAAYDYAELAKHADYLVLMAYDEHCYAGAEGPVAGIDFVKQSLKVVLEDVSKDKVLLGIPLYGRFWQEGEDVGGEAIVIGQVNRIIQKYNVVPTYHIDKGTPELVLTIDEGEMGPYVNGEYLEPGTYHIWYENEHSIKEKLSLINEYNILGAALWALDNEGSDFWKYYKNSLNEKEYNSEREIELRQEHEELAKIIIDMPMPKFESMLNIEKTTSSKVFEFAKKDMKVDKYVKTLSDYTIIPSSKKIKIVHKAKIMHESAEFLERKAKDVN